LPVVWRVQLWLSGADAMPTGYTAAVQDGTITEFKDFAMQCARAFGALVTMRDDPSDASIPEKLEPHTKYYDERLAAAEARLTELRAMTPEQVRQAALDAHVAAMEAWAARRQERERTRQRYEAMLAKVNAWEPPTADHVELARFMRQQLEESIRFDTSSTFDEEPTTLAGEAWRADEIRKVERDINYHTKHRAEEIARTADRNQWLADLRASLEGR
jgi:hypothetical protein